MPPASQNRFRLSLEKKSNNNESFGEVFKIKRLLRALNIALLEISFTVKKAIKLSSE